MSKADDQIHKGRVYASQSRRGTGFGKQSNKKKLEAGRKAAENLLEGTRRRNQTPDDHN